MRPKERQDRGQTVLLRSRLDGIVDMSHPLARLAGAIDWWFLEEWFGVSIVCGRPVGCKRFLAGRRQCGQARSCVRPRDAAVHLPRARMEVRGPGPSRRRALEALRLTLVF